MFNKYQQKQGHQLSSFNTHTQLNSIVASNNHQATINDQTQHMNIQYARTDYELATCKQMVANNTSNSAFNTARNIHQPADTHFHR